jgi:hypothetical protein
LPVAAAAGRGNVRVIDRRVGMAAGEHRMGFSMAVLAAGAYETRAGHFRVHAVRVRGGCIGMTGDAGDLLRRRVVCEALHVLVAIDAIELH